ncbi:M56 family metallopeptidase [Dyadobacter beijingensis]|uniref:M56 family metallopeptidase n=1 Tax=Dyadobacter beijingensis TaxID=365489 RepID=UPI001E46F133|nr:M56 family metallopeptidase [Dyadobacter beijingensis]
MWLNAAAAWTLPLVKLPDWGPKAVQAEFHHSIPKVVGKLPMLGTPLATVQFEALHVTSATAGSSVNTAEWMIVLYLGGVLALSAYFLFQIGRLFFIVTRGKKEQCVNGTCIVRVAGSTPYSFFKWIILDVEKHSDSELRNIVAHESEHARQWHSADLLLGEIQRIFLWFNPFAWVHQKLVQENLEYLADRAVLDNGFEKKQYQYNLLNTALRTHELPLTNSFAQSLLKKRIKMMNRKPSHYLVWGKYAVALALIYISSAFVAPYREQMIRLTPKEIRPFVTPLVGEVIDTKASDNQAFTDEKYKSETDSSTNASKLSRDRATNVENAKSEEFEPKSTKGILIVNKTLYWAITPLTTWDDINAIKAVMKKFGQEFEVNKLQFDPLQQYITAVSVRISSKGGYGTGEEQGDAEFEPMKGYSGFISGFESGMGRLPPAPLLNEMEQDYEKALAIAKRNEVAYFEFKLGQSLGAHSARTYTRQLLIGPNAAQSYNKNGIGTSAANTLQISDYHKNATLYLNTGTTTFTELNELPISKVERVTLLEDSARRKYIIVYAR